MSSILFDYTLNISNRNIKIRSRVKKETYFCNLTERESSRQSHMKVFDNNIGEMNRISLGPENETRNNDW